MALHRSCLPIAVFVSVAAVGGSQRQPPPVHQPQFQSGIELVVVDVGVLSRDGTPVTTLEPSDFSLTVDKRPRAIHSVRLVGSSRTDGAPVRSAAPGVVSPGPRRFVLVIDREHIPAGEGQEMLAAAARFVDGLGPDDRVALWTTAQTDASIDFSEPRDSLKQRLRLAVGVYRPPFGPWNVTLKEALDAETRSFGGRFDWVYPNGLTEAFPLSLKSIIERECHQQPDACPKQVQSQVTELAREARQLADAELARLQSLLAALTPLDGPKHVVLITGGPVMTVDNASIVHGIGAQAAMARATVHALQIHDAGYQARPDQMRATAERVDQAESAAYALAAVTGGLALTPVSGDTGFSRLARELSATYLLAFETEPADRDGQVHDIEVHVRDRGWGSHVRARQTFRIDSRVIAGAVPGVVRLTAQAATSAPTPSVPAQAVVPQTTAANPIGQGERPSAPSTQPQPPVDPAVAEVVRKMAAYVASYGPQASVIVGVEKYTQQVWVEERYARPRSLVADFAIVKADGRVGWTGFRDVVEVDGKEVADRRDRLLGVLTGPPGREAELLRLADESARYNVGPVIRNFNVPTTALFFFHPDLVDRFTFRRAGTRTIDGAPTWELDFQETQRPTLVMKRDGSDVPCEGTVWVSPADGTVVRTRLRLRNFADLRYLKGADGSPATVGEFVPPSPPTQVVVTPTPQQNPPSQPIGTAPPPQPPSSSGGTGRGTTVPSGGGVSAPRRTVAEPEQLPQIVELESLVDIEVTYRKDPASGIWLPSRMSEVYEGPIPLGTKPPVAGRTVGTARYSDFKRFQTSVRIVLPK